MTHASPERPGFITADFVVVGSGIAGLYAALRLSSQGQVILLTKERLAESNTQFAQGGIAAAFDERDSPALHLEDTVRAGAGLCAVPAVRVMVNQGPAYVRDLMTLGAHFDRQNGKLALTREGAHSLRRILHARGDATGEEIQEVLSRQARTVRIPVHEDTLAADLVVEDGRCRGLTAVTERGEVLSYRARATILATGGAGQIYRHTTNATVVTGDGMSMALRAGVMLMDMEFFQFHPTGLGVEANPRFLISEAVRGEGALLLDAQGERFMPRYHTLAELAPRDVVARAIVAELQRSGEAHVWLDARRLTSGPSRLRFPTIHAHCLRLGVDMDKDLIPVTPVAHYCMGGIRADTLARTTLPGLLACGETACSGTHGANRLASNSLLESLVFAGRAADFLLGWDGQSWHTDLLEPFGPRSDGGAVSACLAETWEPHGKPVGDDAPSPVAAATQAGVKALMWRDFGLVREAETMARGRRELDALAERFCLSGELRGGGQAALEAKNMLLAGMAVAASAAARHESRGAHYRADHPHPDPRLESHTAAGLAGGRLELARVPLENTEV